MISYSFNWGKMCALFKTRKAWNLLPLLESKFSLSFPLSKCINLLACTIYCELYFNIHWVVQQQTAVLVIVVLFCSFPFHFIFCLGAAIFQNQVLWRFIDWSTVVMLICVSCGRPVFQKCIQPQRAVKDGGITKCTISLPFRLVLCTHYIEFLNWGTVHAQMFWEWLRFILWHIFSRKF